MLKKNTLKRVFFLFVSTLVAMASTLVAMASNLLGMAFNLIAMASTFCLFPDDAADSDNN